jgi:uncharacterized protein YggE
LSARIYAVSAIGTVEYTPDIARLSVGVNGRAGTAAAAAAGVNARAQSVVAAIRRLGINERSIKTTGYNLQYERPQPRPIPLATPEPARLMQSYAGYLPHFDVVYIAAPKPGGRAQTSAAAAAAYPRRVSAATAPAPATRGFPNEKRFPLPDEGGVYVANETIEVICPLSKAGALLDGAINAGANESYGLSYDTTQRERLYNQALGKAVRSARQQAQIIAQAAGVSLGGLQSISIGGGFMPQPGEVFAARAQAPAPVLGGTSTVSVSVQAVYRLR